MKTYALKRILECLIDTMDFPQNAAHYEADLKRWLEFLISEGK